MRMSLLVEREMIYHQTYMEYIEIFYFFKKIPKWDFFDSKII